MTPSERNSLRAFLGQLGRFSQRAQRCAKLYYTHGNMADFELHAAYMAKYGDMPITPRHMATYRRSLCKYSDRETQSTIARRRDLCKATPPIVGDTGHKKVDPSSGEEVQEWGLISRGAKVVGLSKTERRDKILEVLVDFDFIKGIAPLHALEAAIASYGEGLPCCRPKERP